MNDKDDLLSIGEFAKLSGVGIRALHYYEKKNLLRPIFVDPNSSYRYYSLDQLYHVTLISNCVGLDIPLKELVNVLQKDDMESISDFMNKCNKVAMRKIKLLEVGIEAFNKALQKIESGKLYEPKQIYYRKFEEKTYYIKPLEQPLKGSNLIKSISEMAYDMYGNNFSRIVDEDNIEDLLALPEFGNLCKSSANELKYYSLAEVPKTLGSEDKITIPASSYFFRLDVRSRIEEAHEIFKEQLKNRGDYMVIETSESLLSKSKISQPMYELRLIIN